MEKPSMREVWVAGVVLFLILPLGFCMLLMDASSRQSAEECFRKMHQPIMRAIDEFAAGADLREGAIRHVFYGNERQIERLARAFSNKGWQATFEPHDEIGWGVEVTEKLSQFRTAPSRRVRAMCELADRRNVLYASWGLSGPHSSLIVLQVGDEVSAIRKR